MPENLMNTEHKINSKQYRDNYDEIFKKKCKKCNGEVQDNKCVVCGNPLTTSL